MSYPMAERHAVYATTSEGITFRVGKPTDWDTAQRRWSRLDDPRFRREAAIQIRHARRWYTVQILEVRSVDRHEIGLGSNRHTRAIPVPYLAHRRVNSPAPSLARVAFAR